MGKLIGLLFFISSLSAVAFDHVSEVLPSGKILICKSANQVRNGNIVENYRLKKSSNRFDKSKEKVSEFSLPLFGGKIKISRSAVIRKNRFESSYVETDIGEAVVIEPDFTNELRNQITYPLRSIHKEIQAAFTQSEIEKVISECIVAAPVGSAKFQSRDSVKF